MNYSNPSPSRRFERHPLILQAIADFRPRAGAAGITTLRLKSTGLIRVADVGDGRFATHGEMPRWLRLRMRLAENARQTNGIPGIFLIEHLAFWRKKRETWRRAAPLYLIPVRFDDAERSFTICGSREPNPEFSALTATGQAIVEDEDPAFRAILLQTADLRGKMRIVNPTDNPAFLEAPAVLRLLDAAKAPAPPFRDRSADLKAQRRTPLDEDQEAAYELALSGANMIVLGPPGTGKSETIAEIARAALEAGRRVMIASSVASALTVAQTRLAATGHDKTFQDALALETPDTFPVRPRDEPCFDLLIVDEATRTTVSEALMLASKGRQIIVCGDPHQLGTPDDRPNLFAHAVSLGFPSVMLKKHYRSRTSDLILFSNTAAYGMDLRVAPPIDLMGDHGVKLITCAAATAEQTPTGVINIAEADYVASRLAELVAAGDRRSKCVVTTTPAQAQAIRAAIDARSLTHAQLSPNDNEPFFVKIMNQVQGEERDFTIVSLAFAPKDASSDQALGVFANASGGLERLNVALSRSRSHTEVLASFTADALRSAITYATRPLQLLLNVYSAGLTGLGAMPTIQIVEDTAQYIRQRGDRFDNLGILHGWARPSAKTYQLGILIRWKLTPRHIWATAEAQLRVNGWNLVTFDPEDLKNDMTRVLEEIEAASRRSFERTPISS